MAQELVEVRRYTAPTPNVGELERLLAVHWRALHMHGLVTDAPPLILRQAGADRTTYVEVFAWADGPAIERAETTPAIRSVREPMQALCTTIEDDRYATVPQLELDARLEGAE
ncbi:MAG: hypothetical protein RIT81_27810 [Deltaproteobacteria bacterium]